MAGGKRPEIPEDLDRVLEALASAHRREIVYLVGLQPHAINRLAEARGISLQAMHKHVRILEGAGLVLRRKVGRTNYLTLNRSALLSLQGWLNAFHAWWGSPAETLENYESYLTGTDARRKEKR